MAIDVQTLRKVPLLSELDDRELKHLAQDMTERHLEPGEVLLDESRGGIAFFMILEGEAEVTVHGQPVGTLRGGDYAGEVALFDLTSHRTATVTARTPLHVTGISAQTFRPFVRDHRDVSWKLLTTLAQRLRAAEERNAAAAQTS